MAVAPALMSMLVSGCVGSQPAPRAALEDGRLQHVDGADQHNRAVHIKRWRQEGGCAEAQVEGASKGTPPVFLLSNEEGTWRYYKASPRPYDSSDWTQGRVE